MKLDMRQSAITSDNYFSLISSWTNAPFTMTTTIQSTTATIRRFGDSCGEMVSIEMSSTSDPSPSPSTPTDNPPIISQVTTPLPEWTSLPTPTSSAWHGTEDALTDEPSKSISENYGVIPLYDMFAFSWSEQHKYVLKQVLEKVIDTVEVVWNIFRKVYHYPLDPP